MSEPTGPTPDEMRRSRRRTPPRRKPDVPHPGSSRRGLARFAAAAALMTVATSCAAVPGAAGSASASLPSSTSSTALSPGTEVAPGSTTGTIPSTSVLTTPCGWRATPPATYASVVWIWMENRSYNQVIGSATMPHLNTLARRCGIATNSHGVTHPSLPNYLAAVSGSTGGVVTDCGPAACPQRRTTLFDQLAAAHKSWRTYAQGMRTNCSTVSTYPYAPKHNPAVYFPALRASCRVADVPLGTPTAGPLRSALVTGKMPSFAFVVPGLCDDGHDCPNANPDTWVATWLPRMLASPQYVAGKMLIVITYDEGSGGSSGQSCVTSSASGCRIATVVIAPTTRPGTRSSTSFSHYSLLRTTEDVLGIRVHLGAAARAASMRTAFHL